MRMPSGMEMDDYYVLEYPDWINVIAITDDGKFIIEEQYRHGTQSIDYMIIRNQPIGFYCKCDAQTPMCKRRKLS